MGPLIYGFPVTWQQIVFLHVGYVRLTFLNRIVVNKVTIII